MTKNRTFQLSRLEFHFKKACGGDVLAVAGVVKCLHQNTVVVSLITNYGA